MTIPEPYSQLLPMVVQWAKAQEQHILANGEPLTADEQIDAHFIGVKDITRVRLLKVDVIPPPDHPQLVQAMKATGFWSPHVSGITFGHGIYVRAERWGERRLVAHELTHTAQYERLGGFSNFLQAYLGQCLTVGYDQAPLEIEAREMEIKVLAT